MRHALLSLVSVIVSTLKGVEYLLTNDTLVLVALVNIYKGTPSHENGSVCHRFLTAILQKVSIKRETAVVFVEFGMLEHLQTLLQQLEGESG